MPVPTVYGQRPCGGPEQGVPHGQAQGRPEAGGPVAAIVLKPPKRPGRGQAAGPVEDGRGG
jgi:hypothetical protein